ncbi:hypothetical protein [Paracoccus benzoatiresistens]|uniref:Uncharacterized protein n=1 Tax=Paracoccus benzoatiresistens TaxID=2997341 RepID=A0ABT4JAZ3_9RHOB|nr:hypothetical protein [Paracoccus sp. EF6]MCZ0963875.1 hypothetical protein [Paracoccus sp. EF6]
MIGNLLSRSELKAACLALLDAAAIEHPAGHQGKLAARYLLRTEANERIGLMFEKDERTKANLWVDQAFVRELLDSDIEQRTYLASSLYRSEVPGGKQTYGRHAALKAMRDLAHADLVRFTISEPDQLQWILDHLASARPASRLSASSIT